MTALVEASASQALTSRTSVPVGASSGIAVKYNLLAKVGTLSLTSSTMTLIVPVPVRAGDPRGQTYGVLMFMHDPNRGNLNAEMCTAPGRRS